VLKIKVDVVAAGHSLLLHQLKVLGQEQEKYHHQICQNNNWLIVQKVFLVFLQTMLVVMVVQSIQVFNFYDIFMTFFYK
jgi:hypothetical protein